MFCSLNKPVLCVCVVELVSHLVKYYAVVWAPWGDDIVTCWFKFGVPVGRWAPGKWQIVHEARGVRVIHSSLHLTFCCHSTPLPEPDGRMESRLCTAALWSRRLVLHSFTVPKIAQTPAASSPPGTNNFSKQCTYKSITPRVCITDQQHTELTQGMCIAWLLMRAEHRCHCTPAEYVMVMVVTMVVVVVMVAAAEKKGEVGR